MVAVPEPVEKAQTTRHVLMIRPRRFGVNGQTAASNCFQWAPRPGSALASQAVAEVEECARILAAAGVLPLVLDDTEHPAKPDAVFPNNWVSFHAGGHAVLYPMRAANRRPERRPDILAALPGQGFEPFEIIDLSHLESQGLALEGTGSLVLDRPARVAFAALSSRTHAGALDVFAARTGYRAVVFQTLFRGRPVYHTNVMLAVGRRFAVLCDQIIPAAKARNNVLAELETSRREVIRIDAAQMAAFAANLLELDSGAGPLIALSTTALASLHSAQRRRLESYGQLLPVPLAAVEMAGGGLRCMLAELFLPRIAGAHG